MLTSDATVPLCSLGPAEALLDRLLEAWGECGPMHLSQDGDVTAVRAMAAVLGCVRPLLAALPLQYAPGEFLDAFPYFSCCINLFMLYVMDRCYCHIIVALYFHLRLQRLCPSKWLASDVLQIILKFPAAPGRRINVEAI